MSAKSPASNVTAATRASTWGRDRCELDHCIGFVDTLLCIGIGAPPRRSRWRSAIAKMTGWMLIRNLDLVLIAAVLATLGGLLPQVGFAKEQLR